MSPHTPFLETTAANFHKKTDITCLQSKWPVRFNKYTVGIFSDRSIFYCKTLFNCSHLYHVCIMALESTRPPAVDSEIERRRTALQLCAASTRRRVHNAPFLTRALQAMKCSVNILFMITHFLTLVPVVASRLAFTASRLNSIETSKTVNFWAQGTVS